MESTWLVLSPRPFRDAQAIEAACDRAVDAYLEENPDCEDTFGEVAAARTLPDEATVKKALGRRKGAADVLARLASCRSALAIEQPGSLDDDPLQVAILGFVVAHAGDGVVILDGVPRLSEDVIALLDTKTAAESFGGDADPELFLAADAAEPRASRILATFEVAQQNIDLAIDLRHALGKASDLARRYAMLLVQEGAVDDARAARALKVHPADLDDAAEEVLALTRQVRPTHAGADPVHAEEAPAGDIYATGEAEPPPE
jgi:hypothetical protein